MKKYRGRVEEDHWFLGHLFQSFQKRILSSYYVSGTVYRRWNYRRKLSAEGLYVLVIYYITLCYIIPQVFLISLLCCMVCCILDNSVLTDILKIYRHVYY